MAFSVKLASRGCVTLCAAVFFAACAVMSCWGVFTTTAGRAYLHRLSLTTRGKLVGVPVAERGIGWHVQDLAAKLAFEAPAFMVGFSGDRNSMFRASQETADGSPGA